MKHIDIKRAGEAFFKYILYITLLWLFGFSMFVVIADYQTSNTPLVILVLEVAVIIWVFLFIGWLFHHLIKRYCFNSGEEKRE